MNCKHCGNPIPNDVSSCGFCGEPVYDTYVASNQQTTSSSNGSPSAPYQTTATPHQTPSAPYYAAPAVKSEIVITGIIGAVIGAVIGAAVIILLSRLGFIASISGFILAICTLKGYELLGRRFSMTGLIVCLILIIVTPYIADRLDWAILVKESNPDVSLWEAFSMIPDLIKYEFIEKSVYIKNLVMLYLFAAIGAFNTVRSLFA